MAKEGSNKIANFMTHSARVLVPGCGHINHIVKTHFLKTNLPPYSQAWIRQTYYIVIMTKEGSTKMINSMTPGTVVLVRRHDHLYNK